MPANVPAHCYSFDSTDGAAVIATHVGSVWATQWTAFIATIESANDAAELPANLPANLPAHCYAIDSTDGAAVIAAHVGSVRSAISAAYVRPVTAAI